MKRALNEVVVVSIREMIKKELFDTTDISSTVPNYLGKNYQYLILNHMKRIFGSSMTEEIVPGRGKKRIYSLTLGKDESTKILDKYLGYTKPEKKPEMGNKKASEKEDSISFNIDLRVLSNINGCRGIVKNLCVIMSVLKANNGHLGIPEWESEVRRCGGTAYKNFEHYNNILRMIDAKCRLTKDRKEISFVGNNIGYAWKGCVWIYERLFQTEFEDLTKTIPVIPESSNIKEVEVKEPVVVAKEVNPVGVKSEDDSNSDYRLISIYQIVSTSIMAKQKLTNGNAVTSDQVIEYLRKNRLYSISEKELRTLVGNIETRLRVKIKLSSDLYKIMPTDWETIVCFLKMKKPSIKACIRLSMSYDKVKEIFPDAIEESKISDYDGIYEIPFKPTYDCEMKFYNLYKSFRSQDSFIGSFSKTRVENRLKEMELAEKNNYLELSVKNQMKELENELG